jgi:hypothetical protein
MKEKDMRNTKIDKVTGDVRCPKCKDTSFSSQRSIKGKIGMGIMARKPLKYNGSDTAEEGPPLMESIEMDCAPDFEPGHTAYFWYSQWAFDVPRDGWVRDVQPVIRPRIIARHEAGVVRAGGW